MDCWKEKHEVVKMTSYDNFDVIILQLLIQTPASPDELVVSTVIKIFYHRGSAHTLVRVGREEKHQSCLTTNDKPGQLIIHAFVLHDAFVKKVQTLLSAASPYSKYVYLLDTKCLLLFCATRT